MPDTQVLGILVIAMIAGVILFRLYTVLGRRTGHEPPPEAARPGRLPGSEPVALPPAAEVKPDVSGHGLLDIQVADKEFDTQNFLKGAREAYAQIITGFHKGDRAALKPLLSDEVFTAFDAAIAGRGAAVPPAFTSLKDARIVGASLTGALAEITVAFTAEFSDAPDAAPHDVVDVWTFSRLTGDANPNWTLSATSGEPPE